MLSVNKRPAAPDYSMCDQTVTVYHAQNGKYSRQVIKNAFFDFKKTQNTDKIGSREENSFLLVIPCDRQTVFAGDKVVLGEQEEITTAGEWAKLIPTIVDGLVVVRYVDVKYYGGRIVHIEAGG